ncbi:LOW QUALITY PROTEIN: hypothetical protein KUTeg_016373 [Tegillarca granosa]|uniref:Uncharacterized protein n=1 Tax=Tegillarca granosa TaxID=220873 RepID=A0ABQ9EKN9_TEGGR|nr:LOW QUALITY PROTEIN: hypothetical protein KUTeg_016373 [Tegillarca granosa]
MLHCLYDIYEICEKYCISIDIAHEQFYDDECFFRLHRGIDIDFFVLLFFVKLNEKLIFIMRETGFCIFFFFFLNMYVTVHDLKYISFMCLYQKIVHLLKYLHFLIETKQIMKVKERKKEILNILIHSRNPKISLLLDFAIFNFLCVCSLILNLHTFLFIKSNFNDTMKLNNNLYITIISNIYNISKKMQTKISFRLVKCIRKNKIRAKRDHAFLIFFVYKFLKNNSVMIDFFFKKFVMFLKCLIYALVRPLRMIRTLIIIVAKIK